MMNNKKIILAAVGLLLVLLFAFAAFMLFRGIGQFKGAEEELATARSQLDRFYEKGDPFPTAENISTVRQNTELMESWIGEIVDIAKRKQVDPAETRSPSVFINTLTKVRNSLQSKARGEVDIDEDFGFGFERYVEGQPATPDYVPRLMQQLLIVSDICNILIEEKIEALDDVGREEFEGATAEAPRRVVRPVPSKKPSPRRGKKQKSTTAKGSAPVNLRRASSIDPAAADPMAGEFDEDAIDAKTKLSFDFRAKEGALINILNKLAQNEMFIVVTCVDVEAAEADVKDKKDKPVPSARPAVTGGDWFSQLGGVKPSEGEEGDGKASTFERTPSREERLVYGEKVQQPYSVHLEIEVYRFK